MPTTRIKLTAFALFIPILAILTVQATLSQESLPSGQTEGKLSELVFMTVLLSNAIPWIASLIPDILICKRSANLGRSTITGIMAMVLGYPSIWGAMAVMGSGKLLNLDPLLAWSLSWGVLVLTLSLVKIIAYWVVNEKFPDKATAAFFAGSSAILAITATILSCS